MWGCGEDAGQTEGDWELLEFWKCHMPANVTTSQVVGTFQNREDRIENLQFNVLGAVVESKFLNFFAEFEVM